MKTDIKKHKHFLTVVIYVLVVGSVIRLNIVSDFVLYSRLVFGEKRAYEKTLFEQSAREESISSKADLSYRCNEWFGWPFSLLMTTKIVEFKQSQWQEVESRRYYWIERKYLSHWILNILIWLGLALGSIGLSKLLRNYKIQFLTRSKMLLSITVLVFLPLILISFYWLNLRPWCVTQGEYTLKLYGWPCVAYSQISSEFFSSDSVNIFCSLVDAVLIAVVLYLVFLAYTLTR